MVLREGESEGRRLSFDHQRWSSSAATVADWAVMAGAKQEVLSGLSMGGEGTDGLLIGGRRMTAGDFAAGGGAGGRGVKTIID